MEIDVNKKIIRELLLHIIENVLTDEQLSTQWQGRMIRDWLKDI